jgi:hypothetical protein
MAIHPPARPSVEREQQSVTLMLLPQTLLSWNDGIGI